MYIRLTQAEEPLDPETVDAACAGGPPVRWLAMAGIAAPIWFTALVILQGLLQPDYGHVTMPISALAAWPLGWVQRLNFYVFGGLMAAFAVGICRAVQPGRGGMARGLLLTSGAGVVLAGLSSWSRSADGGFVEPIAHTVGAFMTFLGAGGGLVALSRRMARDPAWRNLSAYTLACGVTMLVLFPAMGALAMRDGAPLRGVAGLLQRLILLVWFPCTLVLATRLLRLDGRPARWPAPGSSSAAPRSPRP